MVTIPVNPVAARDRSRFTAPAFPLLAIFALTLSIGCGGDGSGAPGTSPAPGAGRRLAWSQAAGTLAAAHAYRFTLFVDGVPTRLSDVMCAEVPGQAVFECSAPLPSLASGRHVLELAAFESSTGMESPRSAQLIVGASTSVAQDATPPAEHDGSAPDLGDPSVACADGKPARCFAASLVAADIGPVRRLRGLPDGRVLVLKETGAVAILPSGVPEVPDLGRAYPVGRRTIADIAIDHDFANTRLMYVAVVVSAPGRPAAVSVVRVREVADSLGEAATIVADLPAMSPGLPAVSSGPGGHLYLAMPGAAGHAPAGSYDGRILRFTRDGASAGPRDAASPVVGVGVASPAAIAWAGGNTTLLLADGSPAEGRGLSAVDIDVIERAAAASPAVLRNLPTGALVGGLKDLAVRGGAGAGASLSLQHLWLLGLDPPALYIASATTAGGSDLRRQRVPLGALAPQAIAVVHDDLIVAVTTALPEARVNLLRLRAWNLGSN